MYMAIVKVENGRVAKFQEYASKDDADAHITRVLDDFPNAFVVEMPRGGNPNNLLIAGKSVSVSARREPDGEKLRRLRDTAYEAEDRASRAAVLQAGVTPEAVAYRQEFNRQKPA